MGVLNNAAVLSEKTDTGIYLPMLLSYNDPL